MGAMVHLTTGTVACECAKTRTVKMQHANRDSHYGLPKKICDSDLRQPCHVTYHWKDILKAFCSICLKI